MQKDKRLAQPVIVLGLTILFLFAVSLLPEDLTLFGLEIKHVDIISDLKIVEDEDDFQFEEYYEEPGSIYADSSGEQSSTITMTNVNLAGISFESALNLSSEFFSTEFEKLESYKTPAVRTDNQDISGNASQLSKFYSALKSTGRTQIRIAHFGDSGIEGDLVSADLREILQSKFGGKGVGFLPIITEGINYRQSMNFSYSKDWETFGINTRNPQRLPVGINGEIFINKGLSWFEYEAKPRFRNSRTFESVKLYYSDAKNSTINYSTNNGTKQSVKLIPGSGVKEVKLNTGSSKSIRFELTAKEQAYFYGISLEDGTGIYVDNFPLRGNSGVDLKDIPLDNLRDFNKYMDYKLIIFQFGLNALSERMGNYKRYEKDMINVVEHFKKAFPGASFILIGAQDRSVKRGSDFETDPSLAKLIQAQINITRETKIAFWNLFETMGGKNSMIDWVNSNPPLAHKDYIHFNESGVKKVAELFSEALLKNYR